VKRKAETVPLRPCGGCKKPIRWGSRGSDGRLLAEPARASLCFECSARKRKGGRV